MLLNTILTIGESDSKSHQKLGWEEITDEIIHSIPSDVIFVLWGKIAQKKKKILNTEYIIESAHPSPLSASKGFFGSKPFSTINRMLIEMGKEPINWSI
jgi:uracil-DNA glycosylase